ncbi:MAG: cache domain-containing protein [Candidatus Omnitrophica bacterium]|nr:cache domain-containing protein [Candidatus Omnitrophota bacterium]
MKPKTLKTTLLLYFFAVIVSLAASITFLGCYVIQKDIIDRAQAQVRNNLKAARSFYDDEMRSLEKAFRLLSLKDAVTPFQNIVGLDYMYSVSPEGRNSIKSGIVRAAAQKEAIASGTRIIGRDELVSMGSGLYEKAALTLKLTPKALPTDRTTLEEAMAMECAVPLYNADGSLAEILYGGRIINRDFALVDKIRDSVFENRMYNGRPLGTVTIFQGDVRVTTNVLTRGGERAIGTRVSQRVYENVIEEGHPWIDRAFVVTDWYLTAYEPIRDINGSIIGILYVGTLEKPFWDMKRNILFVFLTIIGGAVVLATLLAFVLAGTIDRPVTDMLEATRRISGGEMNYRITNRPTLQELDELSESFNAMVLRLNEREMSLRFSNERLELLNKNYLDLVGFVTHELKGILASAILSAYSVRDGFLGMVNFKQRKALDSVTRNLDYLETTVRNFLDLSRIEKGEIELHEREIMLREDVFEIAVHSFMKSAEEKGMTIINDMSSGVLIKGDADLLTIVANNILGNAVKYGAEGGAIRLSTALHNGTIEAAVYNDGPVIDAEGADKLFQKFSRPGAYSKKQKGTGLGLFITKEIIERHRGSIRYEAREKGSAFIITFERRNQ